MNTCKAEPVSKRAVEARWLFTSFSCHVVSLAPRKTGNPENPLINQMLQTPKSIGHVPCWKWGGGNGGSDASHDGSSRSHSQPALRYGHGPRWKCRRWSGLRTPAQPIGRCEMTECALLGDGEEREAETTST